MNLNSSDVAAVVSRTQCSLLCLRSDWPAALWTVQSAPDVSHTFYLFIFLLKAPQREGLKPRVCGLRCSKILCYFKRYRQHFPNLQIILDKFSKKQLWKWDLMSSYLIFSIFVWINETWEAWVIFSTFLTINSHSVIKVWIFYILQIILDTSPKILQSFSLNELCLKYNVNSLNPFQP